MLNKIMISNKILYNEYFKSVQKNGYILTERILRRFFKLEQIEFCMFAVPYSKREKALEALHKVKRTNLREYFEMY
jgi:hypothetical protein